MTEKTDPTTGGRETVSAHIKGLHTQLFNNLITDACRIYLSLGRALEEIAGGYEPSVMLARLWIEHVSAADPEGWFIKTREEWARDTGLGRTQQESAKEALKRRGLLVEKRRGMPARVWMRLNDTALVHDFAEMGGFNFARYRFAEAAPSPPAESDREIILVEDTEGRTVSSHLTSPESEGDS